MNKKMNKNYSYRTGDSVEVELFTNNWVPAIFQSYIPYNVNEDHRLNITITRIGAQAWGLQTYPEKVRRIKNNG